MGLYIAKCHIYVLFIILYFLTTYCSSLPTHSHSTIIVDTNLKRNSISVPHIQVLSNISQEEISEINTKFYGTMTAKEMSPSGRERTPFHSGINVPEEETLANNSLSRPKRSITSHTSSPHDVQKWVNYLRLLNYSHSSSCHHSHAMQNLLRKINSTLVINRKEWDKWNVISACATNYSISHNATSEPRHLLNAHCACASDIHIPTCRQLYKCQQVYAKVQVESSVVYHPVGCVCASLKSIPGKKMIQPSLIS